MEALKPRTKIIVIVGTSKVTFSGNRKDVQIITLSNGTEVRANKLSTAFKLRADGFRPVEVFFDEIREQNYRLKLVEK